MFILNKVDIIEEDLGEVQDTYSNMPRLSWRSARCSWFPPDGQRAALEIDDAQRQQQRAASGEQVENYITNVLDDSAAKT